VTGVDDVLEDPVALTDELARAARELSGCDFGLALHAVADPNSKVQNLASGQAYVSLCDGKRSLQARKRQRRARRLRPLAHDPQCHRFAADCAH
jgi:nicotinamide mononucleotide (NMN) deamidase PncC